jgi:hypothetical protein
MLEEEVVCSNPLSNSRQEGALLALPWRLVTWVGDDEVLAEGWARSSGSFSARCTPRGSLEYTPDKAVRNEPNYRIRLLLVKKMQR